MEFRISICLQYHVLMFWSWEWSSLFSHVQVHHFAESKDGSIDLVWTLFQIDQIDQSINRFTIR